MADIKKYLDTTALGTLVDKIKEEDAKVLAAAQKYTDEAPFDAAGSAATAKTEAIADADAKFAVVNENVAKKADATALEAEVTRATNKEAELLASIEATDAIADKNAEDIAAINNAETGILAQAKADATEKANAVQTNVDVVAGDLADLDAYVGTIPDGYTEETVIAYINKKAEETLNAASGGSTESAASVKAALDTEIARAKAAEEANATAASNAQSAADAAQSTADTAKAAIDAFLKEADATETAIDTLKEIQAELAEGEASAASMLAEINALKAIDNATQAELEDALATVNSNIDKKADQTYVEGVEDRVEALEAIDVATKGYVDQAETDAIAAAKTYSDGLDSAVKARLDSLEAVDHDHANKAVLDGITAEKVTAWDDANAKAHEHANKDVIDGITAEKVAAWDAAEGNAKTYADGLNTTMTGKVDAIDSRVETLETTIADKAEADDLDAAVERIAQNETDIAGLTSAINSFTPITSDEVAALFA